MKSIYYIVISYKSDSQNLLRLQKLNNNLSFIDNSNFIPSKDLAKKINLIRNKENLGYGGGANVGLKKALAQGAEWVVILNQDLQLTKNSISDLEKIIQKSQPGLLGIHAGGLDKNRWTTILPSKNVDYLSGACMAIHRDAVEKIGYFYDPYFMYYEDADYSIRAKNAGFPLLYAHVESIKHDDNPSLGKGSYLHEYYLARNHMLFVERLAPLSVKIYEYLRLPKTIMEYRRNNNVGALAGLQDYFLRRFGEKKV